MTEELKISKIGRFEDNDDNYLGMAAFEYGESCEDTFCFGVRHLRLVSFVSRSRGRSRKGEIVRRKSREVELLVVDRKHSLAIKNGEIRSKKSDWSAPRPDELAEEILGRGATVSDLYYEVRRRQLGY